MNSTTFPANTAIRIPFAVKSPYISLHVRYSGMVGTLDAEISVEELNGNPRSDRGVVFDGLPVVIDASGDLISNGTPVGTEFVVFVYDPNSVTAGNVELCYHGLERIYG